VLRGHQLRAVRLMMQDSDTSDSEENERAPYNADGSRMSDQDEEEEEEEEEEDILEM